MARGLHPLAESQTQEGICEIKAFRGGYGRWLGWTPKSQKEATKPGRQYVCRGGTVICQQVRFYIFPGQPRLAY